jgi:NTE family protein
MWKINLVLSGGGARGIAHLGVVKAMQEAGFKIQAISGVSSGAIVGAFIAKGMAPDEILDIAIRTKGFSITRPPFSLGLFNKKNMVQVLSKYFEKTSFSDLDIPLYVSATNINTSNTDYFTSGNLLMSLVASSALPLLFAPVHLNGYQYVDGGFINNLPVEPFLNDPLPRIGVSVNMLKEEEVLTSTLKIVERAIQIAVNKTVEQRKQHFDFIIEPQKLCEYTAYDFGKPQEIFNAGYEYAKLAIEVFANEQEKKQRLFAGKFAA